MRLPRSNNWIAVLICLLVVNVIPPATTPVDQWTGWTFASLLSAVACIVFLLVEITRRMKMKDD